MTLDCGIQPTATWPIADTATVPNKWRRRQDRAHLPRICRPARDKMGRAGWEVLATIAGAPPPQGLHLAPVDVEALTPPSHHGTSPLQYRHRSTPPPPAEKGTATSGEIPATTIAAWPCPTGPLATVSGEGWRLGESLGLTAAGAP
jgi:hypothetical protein